MDRIDAVKKLSNLKKDKRHILVIHYSCESFYQKGDNFSPRITSVCVKKFSENQSVCFSISDYAERASIPLSQIDSDYDSLERRLLDELFDFIGVNQDKYWVHWNMRGSVYGFQAIYHRYRILGGSPIILNESRLFDLAEVLKSIYGKDYAPHPRLEKLCELNNLSMKDFLAGAAEADAFERKDFAVLKMSTARKVDLLSDILSLAFSGRLRKEGNAIIQRINELSINPFLVLLGLIVTLVTGLYTIYTWLPK